MEKNKANISLRLLTLGDRAIAVEFGQAIELDINQRVMALRDKIQQAIQQEKLAGIVEMVPTYCSLLVEYNPLLISYDELAQTLQQMAEHIEVAETVSKEVVEIPVVYGGEYGPDLVEVAEYHQLSLHTYRARISRLYAGLCGRISLFGRYESSFGYPPEGIP